MNGLITIDRFIARRECREILRLFAQQRPQTYTPNSMNRYGAIAVNKDLRELCNTIVKAIAPRVRAAFPEIGKLYADPYAFLVRYATGEQRSLARHRDSSDVTLNLCLGDPGFEGGDLWFFKGRQRERVEHDIGRAILHRGSLEHRATPTTIGVRHNLILWCAEYGSKYRSPI